MQTRIIEDESEHLKQEREKARRLRSSPWWKRRKDTGLCHYCGGTYRPSDLTMDHIVPLARGGRSTKGNVVPSCKACNSKKKHELVWEWIGS